MNSGTTGYKRQRRAVEKKMPIKKRQLNDSCYPKNALVVDEVTQPRRLVQHLLESLSFETVAAYNSHEAIQILYNSRIQFDFIFVDFDLSITPGPELVRRIRAMGIRSKVVGMCTNYSDANCQMFQNARANATVAKPLNRETLEIVTGILAIV